MEAAEAEKRGEEEDEMQVRRCLDEDVGEESDGNETERPRR